jgi:hypothetical protein
MVTLTIAATRIYRDLIDYASVGCTQKYDTTPSHSFSALTAHCGRYGRSDPIGVQRSGPIEWKGNTASTKLSRMEVAINRTYEQDQTPQTSQYGSLVSAEGQSCEKPTRERRFDEDTENGVGSLTQFP